MKKIIALVLTLIAITMTLTACNMGKCDICGDTGILKEREIFGTTVYVCTDCLD